MVVTGIKSCMIVKIFLDVDNVVVGKTGSDLRGIGLRIPRRQNLYNIWSDADHRIAQGHTDRVTQQHCTLVH